MTKLSGFIDYDDTHYKNSCNYKTFLKAYFQLSGFCEAFNLKVEYNLEDIKPLLEEIFLYMGEKERTRSAKKAVKDAEKAVLREQARKDQLKATFFKRIKSVIAWKRGGYGGHFQALPVFLRIKGDIVETSKGARVPLDKALMLYGLIRKGKEIKGLRIGHYTCTYYNNEKVVIGCHSIALKEVERVLSAYILKDFKTPNLTLVKEL